MLYNGEQIGDGSPPVVDIAVDPLEGTRLCAQGEPSALAVVALAERGTMFDPGPCVYMEKIAGGRGSPTASASSEPISEVIGRVAERKGGERRRGDRGDARSRPPRRGGRGDPRARRAHPLHHRRRRLGGAARGQPQAPGSTCSGGSAARRGRALRGRDQVLGGQILGRLWPRDEEERKAAIDAGYDLDRDPRRRPPGQRRRRLLRRHRRHRRRPARRVRYLGGGKATTESLVMRSRSGTVRKVGATPRPGEAARG